MVTGVGGGVDLMFTTDKIGGDVPCYNMSTGIECEIINLGSG